ncbi:MAG: 16S rRNA (guanine1207-N2)-methyltransferase [Candidatus Endobugula sp.]|jgi:16S rRNA (guanine1207-N2)-methyltransferase
MSFLDSSFTSLLPYLQSADVPTLWIADENALSALQHFEQDDYPLLSLITNRYDIYTLAKNKNINATFSDFNFDHFYENAKTDNSSAQVQRIIYRVSKEKALTHYLLNQACKLLHQQNSGSLGELILSGKKQEGIKSYQKKLLDTFECKGKLKKQGLDYSGVFSGFTIANNIPDSDYTSIQHLPTPNHPHLKVYTKPGVFGWNKVDIGSELLLESLPTILNERKTAPQNILDLGCGYGWIFTNLPFYLPEESISRTTITATDNNATALLCAEKNSMHHPLSVSITPDDCAQNIDEKFDLILCNPPFHQGFSHDKALTIKFLEQTKKHLIRKGIAVFVVNEFIQFPSKQLTLFTSQTIITKKNGFKVVTLTN